MAPHPRNRNSASQSHQAAETVRNYKDQGRLYKRLFGEIGIRVPLFEETKPLSFKKLRSGKEAKEREYIQKSILSTTFKAPKLDYSTRRSNGVKNFHSEKIASKSYSATEILSTPSESELSPVTSCAVKSTPILNGGGHESVAVCSGVNGIKPYNLMKEKRAVTKPRYRFNSDKNHEFSDSDDDDDASTVVTTITSAKSIASIRSYSTVNVENANMPFAQMVNGGFIFNGTEGCGCHNFYSRGSGEKAECNGKWSKWSNSLKAVH